MGVVSATGITLKQGKICRKKEREPREWVCFHLGPGGMRRGPCQEEGMQWGADLRRNEIIGRSFPSFSTNSQQFHWIFRKIRWRDQLGGFCLLDFVILNPTPERIPGPRGPAKARSFPSTCAERAHLELHGDHLKIPFSKALLDAMNWHGVSLWETRSGWGLELKRKECRKFISWSCGTLSPQHHRGSPGILNSWNSEHPEFCILGCFLLLEVLPTLPFHGDFKELHVVNVLVEDPSLKTKRRLQDSSEYQGISLQGMQNCIWCHWIQKSTFWWPFLTSQMENKLLFYDKRGVSELIQCAAAQNRHRIKK